MGLRCLAITCLILAGCGTSPDARYQKGRLMLRQNKYSEALLQAEAGLRAETSWRFRILKADVLIGLSKTKEAKELLLFSDKAPSDPEQLARFDMDLGYAEYLETHFAKAEALLAEAARIAQSLNLPLLDATIANRLGLVAQKRGRKEDAALHMRRSIEIAGSQQDWNLQATAMGDLGYLFLNSFQFDDAIYWFEKSGAILHRLGALPGYYITQGNLGSCYQSLGDSEKAIAYFEQAANYAHHSGDQYQEQLWNGNIGDALIDSGDFAHAAEKFKQALDIGKKRDADEIDLKSWWYFSLASIAIQQRDFDAAEKYNTEALRLRQSIEDRSDYSPRLNEAHIAAGRNDRRAETLYRDLIDEYDEDINPVEMIEAQTGLASLLADKGDARRADAQFHKALALIESRRTALVNAENRMSFLASLLRFHDRYINFLVDQSKYEAALEVAESSRALVLDEELESTSPHATVPVARLKSLAGASHSVFLSYWLGKKRSFLWAVTGEKVQFYQLPAESEIAPLITKYRAFLESLRDPMASDNPAGRKLSKILLSDVAPLLTASRVVLVPDRSLHALNFESLPDPQEPQKYLIERATIEIAPSLNLLAESRPSVKATKALLVMGNPQQAVEEYPGLPFAGSEIDGISRTFAAKNPTVLQGAAARPSAYRDSHPERFSWIHFAAHAASNHGVPLDSALILSRQDSGYQLQAREVMNIPLHANLVTLSACRGAGSRTYSGEGQVGLSWAFLHAGAKSVVAGLWDVNDRSTAELMAELYRQLAQKVAPVDALRKAKLSLLHGGKVYQKPFYWAPFQLYAGVI